MHRCFVSPAAWNDPAICLAEEEEHHLLDVLRAQPGDRVTLFDGQGHEALAQISLAPHEGKVTRRRIVMKIVEAVRAIQPGVSLTLIQALPKGQRMDWIVEKATELGASAIVPVITERVVARLTEKQKADRRSRWQRIALSAAKQCRTNWIPEIRPVGGLSDAVRSCSNIDLFLVGALTPDARLLRTVLHEARAKNPRTLALLVGPEGDLTPAELAEAVRAGAVPVSFGTVVLRVETAALFGMSVLASEFLTEARVGI